MYEANAVYFVTARTIQARFLLRPSADLNEVVGGVLARAVQLHGVELYGYVFASNHVHLLVRARDGVLSRFMQYLLGNLARKVGRLIDWRGTFWERRFSAEPVLDDAALEGRLEYILAHGVKEGLVRHVSEWPGLSCLSQLLSETKAVFRWFHWAKRWANGSLKAGWENPFSEELSERIELEVHALPHWSRLCSARRRQAIAEMVARIEEEGTRAHPTPVGPARVQQIHPHQRPSAPKRAPRPLCHAVIVELKKAFVAVYREFCAAYRLASQRFRAGDLLVTFPPFSFRPPGVSALRS